MDETRNILVLAATLTMLAIVLAVVSQGLLLSENAADLGYAWLTGAIRGSKQSITEITDIASERELPIAAIASILSGCKNKIIYLDCRICGDVTSGYEVGDCLYEHPKGRGKLTFIEQDNGEYIVILEPAP